jgi:hypothetical protein
VEQVAHVDHERGPVAERLAEPAGEFDHVRGRRHHRLDLERAVAERGELFGARHLLREPRFAAPGVRDERAVGRDRLPFAHGRLERPALHAAEQLPHRALQHLAVNAPHRDVERAEDDDLPPAAVGVQQRVPRPLPGPLRVRDLLADEQSPEVRVRSANCRLNHARRHAEHFAQPAQPLVGVNPHARERLGPAPVGVDLPPVADDEHIQTRQLHKMPPGTCFTGRSIPGYSVFHAHRVANRSVLRSGDRARLGAGRGRRAAAARTAPRVPAGRAAEGAGGEWRGQQQDEGGHRQGSYKGS